MTTHETCDLLRRRVVADLHLGRIEPGGRLPSLRTVARELGISIRAAARAYSELEREGLVRVRGRSGIYLATRQTAEIRLEDDLVWHAEMLRDAWARRIRLEELSNMLNEMVGNPARAACVESTEDHMVAFCCELEDDFALNTKSVLLTPDGARVDGRTMSLYDALADVDFAVTTAFHAGEVSAVADQLNIPVVVVSVNDTLVGTVVDHLRERPITIIAEDPAFVDRFRSHLMQCFSSAGEVRVCSINELKSDPSMTEGTLPMFTRAARRHVDEDQFKLTPAPAPFLSAHAARKVVQCMLSAHSKRALQAA